MGRWLPYIKSLSSIIEFSNFHKEHVVHTLMSYKVEFLVPAQSNLRNLISCKKNLHA